MQTLNRKQIDNDFVIRTMKSQEELGEVFKLLDKENCGITRLNFMELVASFHDSCFVIVKKKTQEVIGSIFANPTRDKQRVISCVALEEDYRGLGLGGRMMDFVLRTFHSDTLTLNSVQNAVTFYAKYDFHEIGPTHHINIATVNKNKMKEARCDYDTEDIRTSSYTPDMFPALVSYDSNARGYNSERVLSALTKADVHIRVATSISSGQVVGYVGTVNESPSEHPLLVIDGLFADSDEIAFMLFREILDPYPGTTEIRMRTISPRSFLLQFVNVIKTKQEILTRMANGPASFPCLSKLYVATNNDFCE